MRAVIILKYYAVKNGFKTGIFTSWEECQKQVNGYKNACFKSFSVLEDAKIYLKDEEKEVDLIDAVAYVDGSYDVKTNRYSFGCVFFYQGQEYQYNKAFDDENFALMRNVSGEIKGAAFIIQFCINRGIKKLHLYYDYEGIEKWYTGIWQAKKKETQMYRDFALKAKEKIEVVFHKVKGHSNNKYNDLADRLAKDALGIK